MRTRKHARVREGQAHAEARRLLAAALERIPAIEAPQEPSESPETATEKPMGPETQEAREEAKEAAQPRSGTPWWRRMFGV